MGISARFLGTASGLPEADRFGQTTVLTEEAHDGAARHILLDVGDGAASLLQKHYYDFLAVRAIVISHMHGDHHGGFVQVIKTMMHMQRREPLLVLAPAEGIDGLRQYLELSYLLDELLGFRIDWVPLSQAENTPIAVTERMRLVAHQNNHLGGTRRLLEGRADLPRSYRFESYCFVLEDGETRVVFSGNLDGSAGADELTPFIDPCDLLICELAHLDPTLLGEMVARHDVRAIALAHFHPKWNGVPPSRLLELMEERAPGLGESVAIHFARDGDRIEVGRRLIGTGASDALSSSDTQSR